MRAVRALPVLVLLAFPACDAGREAASGDDLVLELGGDGPSLSADLRVLGVLPAPSAEASRESAPAEDRLEDPAGGDQGDSAAEHEPARPSEQTEPLWFEVEIEEGQTIGALAKKYLGSARRYREILDLNHLTLETAKRIRTGSRIRIPGKPPADRQ
ncbi:MAG: hypothetical protein Fur0037_28480 [Planctomycetota bacterium]